MLGFLSGRAPEQNYSDEPIATKLQALTGPGRILKVFFFLLACVFACIAVIIGIMAIAEIVSNGAGAGSWEELVIAPALTTLTFFAFAIVFYIAALIYLAAFCKERRPYSKVRIGRIRHFSRLNGKLHKL